MSAEVKTVSIDDLIAEIADGCLLGVTNELGGVSMAATRALIRRGVRNLRLFCLPTSSLQADLLIGASCVAEIDTSAVTLNEFGLAPRFVSAVQERTITVHDSACPAMHTMLQATEKGVPFMPLRGLIGSYILRHRPDWKVIDNPFADCGDPIVLLPAVAPDVALMHALMADQEGNVYIGRRREMATLAHAAKRVLFTVERIYPGCFFDDETLAAGALSGLYVHAIAEAPRGAWPLGLDSEYATDGAHMHRYAQMAATPRGFAAYLDAFVFNQAAAAE